MNKKIKLLLVDDETLLTESLEIILSMTGLIDVVGKASDGVDALELLEKLEVDIALVDLNMKVMGGIELISNIKKKYPGTKILVLTTFYDEKNITMAISNGADGYIIKDSGRDAIINAINNVMNGQSVLDSKVMVALSNIVNKTSPALENNNFDNKLLDTLTKREIEVCKMISDGYTNSQISKFLYISEGTVKNYISSIYDKTQIHDRAKLALTLKTYFKK